MRDAITSSCLNFNGGLANAPLKLRHGWIITSYIFSNEISYPCPNSIGSSKSVSKSPLWWKNFQRAYIHDHDDVIKLTHFPRYWPFVRGIPWSSVDSPHKGQWWGAVMFSLICAWRGGWANNRDAADLRRHCAPYDVTVMCYHYFGGLECSDKDPLISQKTFNQLVTIN